MQMDCIWSPPVRTAAGQGRKRKMAGKRRRRVASELGWIMLLGIALWPSALGAQEKPYFVTYDHQLEEAGNLEISVTPVVGVPKTSSKFVGSTLEFGYGVKGWWTTELYLNGQSTRRDSNREIETKLILSSNFRGWNISENFIAEKNLSNKPWEFGYAVGVSRPLALAASSKDCRFCPENLRAGVELYGGLGDAHNFTLSGTAHYLAPVLSWELPSGTTIRFSPAFGLTRNSHRALLRFEVAYEIAGFGRRVGKLFH